MVENVSYDNCSETVFRVIFLLQQSFPARTKTQEARAGLHVLSQEYLRVGCIRRTAQCQHLLLIVDGLFYLPRISNLTPTFSSQQSEVTTAAVCSHKTITRHLPPLGATANVELLSVTLKFLLWFPTPTLEKMIQIRLIAVSCVRTVLKQNKIQVSRRPSCLKTTKGSLQNVSLHAFVAPENPVCYLRPCC